MRHCIKVVTAVQVALLMLITAAPAQERSEEQLQERFKERYPQLLRLKQAGTIGETWHGFVEFVEEAEERAEGVAELVETENADRRELYRLIAERENVTPEHVGQRNARRNFQQARPGEYLQQRDGAWTRKGEDEEEEEQQEEAKQEEDAEAEAEAEAPEQ